MDYKLLLTGAAMTSGAGIIYYLKAIPARIYDSVKSRLIYTVKVYQYDELFDMLEKYLSKFHQEQYRDVEAGVSEQGYSLMGTPQSSSTGKLTYKQEENTFILKHLGKKILITKVKEKVDKAGSSMKDMFFRKFSISGLRAKGQIDSFLKEAIEFCKKEDDKNNLKVYSNNPYGDWEYGSNIRIKPITNVILNPDTKNNIIKDIDIFLSSEEWYNNTHIPYKRGICFYGPPGTGKTTISLALANYTKRNIYCLNLNCIDDDSKLPRCFSNMRDNSILLIEDIDKVFSGRENVKEGSKITFSSLLNCLDGAFYKNGLITIITTNHLDKLDEALLRTGRIDLKVEIPLPSETEISEYLSLFYSESLQVEGEFNLKMSDIQEICISNRYNSDKAIEIILNKKNGRNNSISGRHLKSINDKVDRRLEVYS